MTARDSWSKWDRANPDKLRASKDKYRKAHRDEIVRKKKIKNDTLRSSVVDLLGGRCSNLGCRWLNEDGTFGCIDRIMLQIDHKEGGGREAYAILGSYQIYKQILTLGESAKELYQLLCANCNWKKREINNELVRKNRIVSSSV